MTLNDGHPLNPGVTRATLNKARESRGETGRVTAMEGARFRMPKRKDSQDRGRASREREEEADLRELGRVSRHLDSVLKVRRLEGHHTLRNGRGTTSQPAERKS